MIPTRNQLHDLFRKIESEGVTMKPDFMCCPSCGHAGLDKVKNYGFYHAQACDSACHDGHLYINHGKGVKAARTIAKVLREAGCEVAWTGKADNTIMVKVDARSFDRLSLDNVGADAEAEKMYGMVTYVWHDPFTGWEVRCGDENELIYHGSAHTREDAWNAAYAFIAQVADELLDEPAEA